MKIKRLTEKLFIISLCAAIIWVTWSYAIATYSTIVLGQPFPIEELSREAIVTIIGVSALKVLGNIFEHNDGGLFGTSNTKEDYDEN